MPFSSVRIVVTGEFMSNSFCHEWGKIRLSNETSVEIDQPSYLTEEGRGFFISLVAVMRMVAWRSRLKGLKTDTFLSGEAFITFSKFHLKWKLRVARVVWPYSKLFERYVKVARMTV